MGVNRYYLLQIIVAFPLVLGGAGCGGRPFFGGPPPHPGEKLARVGLKIVSEREALIPPADRGKYLPCRVLPGFPDPALPDHPAGYLILGAGARSSPGKKEILRALSDWKAGEFLSLTVRRNPYLSGGDWYEVKVSLRLPPE